MEISNRDPSLRQTVEEDEAPPPSYDDLTLAFRALQTGPPDEIISVPMISSHEKRSLRGLLGGRKEVVTTVHARRMTRAHYLEHYARDGQGNYIGTGKKAVDAALVFVPSKSTPEETMQKLRETAFAKQHYGDDFGMAPVGGGFAGVGG